MMFRDTKATVTQYRDCARAICFADSESGARVSCIAVSPYYVNYKLCFYQQHLLHALLPNVAATMGCNVTFPILRQQHYSSPGAIWGSHFLLIPLRSGHNGHATAGQEQHSTQLYTSQSAPTANT